MRKLIWIVAVLAFVVGLGAVLTHLRPKVPRESLAIAADEVQRCEAPKLPTYAKTTYQRRVAANDYLPFAVASLNVYKEGAPRGVTLDKHSPEWRQVGTWDKDGLAFNVYHRDEADKLTVLTVLRGTEAADVSDWVANTSFLWAWMPIQTEYDLARLIFQATRKQAYEAAKGRKVGFITAGHSLGGGLARHIALSYPCVSAAVFNSSIIENRFRLAQPFDPLVVHTFEDKDELTQLNRLFYSDVETATYKPYRQDAVKDKAEFQHSITGLAVGMARQVLQCQERRGDCPVPATDSRARQLYCASWGKNDKRLCKAT
jgi:pimeloyl-ACP methyl ester carboxylesterase